MLKNKLENLKITQLPKFITDKENWVVNISNKQIPNNVLEILSLGGKFNYIHTKNTLPINKIVTNIEYNLHNIPIIERNKIRCDISYWLQNLAFNVNIYNMGCLNLTTKISQTKNFINNNNDLIILNADKSNKTVIMNKTDYNIKIFNLLSDSSTYIKLDKDPTNDINFELKSTLLLWKSKKIINDNTFKYLHSNTCSAPKFYGLPKLHKPNCPLRPITSFIGSPTYNLSKCISKSLQKTVGLNEFYIKDSWSFKNKVSNLTIPKNFTIISLDIVSMYTSITWDLIVKSIKNRWKSIKPHTFLNYKDFNNALLLCLNSAYCNFDNNIYKQINGLPMGSPLSATLANIVMEEAETKIINELTYYIKFYYRYIDDTLICLPKNKINDIFDKFNNIHPNLVFTKENSINDSINFLDLNIKVENNKIVTNWYRKPIWSGRYLNFYSNHSLSNKIGIIYSLTDRAILLSHEKYHNENLILVKNTLIKNGYPLTLLNEKIANRYKYLISNKYQNKKLTETNESKENNKKIITLPYINNFQEQFHRIFKNSNLQIIFNYDNTIRQKILKSIKTPTPTKFKYNVVYKIECIQCNSLYIGQTCRFLHNRMLEHARSIKNYNSNSTALALHAHKFKHNFDFSKVKILEHEQNIKKRLLLEMIHIQKNKNSINFRTDIENLSDIYFNIIQLAK